MKATTDGSDQSAIGVLCRLATAGPVGDAEYAVRRSSSLDERTRALVSIAAVIASDGGHGSYVRSIHPAIDAGATVEEIVDVLVEIAPTIGLCRLATATCELAAAVGYDLDEALEQFDPPRQFG